MTNPLKPYAIEIENFLLKLRELDISTCDDDFSVTVKKYFNDNGTISITYIGSSYVNVSQQFKFELLSFRLWFDNDGNVSIFVESPSYRHIGDISKNSKEVRKYIIDKLEKYQDPYYHTIRIEPSNMKVFIDALKGAESHIELISNVNNYNL